MDDKNQSWYLYNWGPSQSNSDSVCSVPVPEKPPGKIPREAEYTIEAATHFVLFESGCYYSLTTTSVPELLVLHINFYRDSIQSKKHKC